MPGPRAALLRIAFRGWWLAGTGASGGSALDMVAYRDADGCPALPMTQVKGVLRQAAEDFGLLGADEIVELFGARSLPGVAAEAVGGALRFPGEARMGAAERAWFRAHPEARAELFAVIRSTAIDPERGVAKTDTLRAAEVAVPVELQGRIEWIAGEPPEDWVERLDRVAAFVPALGKLRADGFGRASLCCTAAAPGSDSR